MNTCSYTYTKQDALLGLEEQAAAASTMDDDDGERDGIRSTLSQLAVFVVHDFASPVLVPTSPTPPQGPYVHIHVCGRLISPA